MSCSDKEDGGVCSSSEARASIQIMYKEHRCGFGLYY